MNSFEGTIKAAPTSIEITADFYKKKRKPRKKENQDYFYIPQELCPGIFCFMHMLKVGEKEARRRESMSRAKFLRMKKYEYIVRKCLYKAYYDRDRTEAFLMQVLPKEKENLRVLCKDGILGLQSSEDEEELKREEPDENIFVCHRCKWVYDELITVALPHE